MDVVTKQQFLLSIATLALILGAYGCQSEPPQLESMPTPLPTQSVIREALEPCGPSLLRYQGYLHRHVLHWTSDGTHLVFDIDDTVWTLNVGSGQLREIADADMNYDRRKGGHKFLYGFYADVSPDGSQVVYAACTDLPSDGADDGNCCRDEGYEILMVNIEGTERKRLTENRHFDNYPVWSPDGTEIAFIGLRIASGLPSDIAHYPGNSVRLQSNAKVSVMPANAMPADEGRASDSQWRLLVGGDIRQIWDSSRVALYPPVWSPDGQYLAFIAHEGTVRPYVRVLYTIGSDGWNLSRIGETTAVPAWSPDGDALVFAAVKEEEAVLYVVGADGTGLDRIWGSGPNGPSAPVGQVAWSPDGSQILFVSDGVYLLQLDAGGTTPLALTQQGEGEAIRATWSPDGSRIAVYYPGARSTDRYGYLDINYPQTQLATVLPDGMDWRVLMKVDDRGMPQPVSMPTPSPNRSDGDAGLTEAGAP